MRSPTLIHLRSEARTINLRLASSAVIREKRNAFAATFLRLCLSAVRWHLSTAGLGDLVKAYVVALATLSCAFHPQSLCVALFAYSDTNPFFPISMSAAGSFADVPLVLMRA